MRVFAKVVEQSSFVAAASVLGLSNAVVTRHVADLESHLGTRLLNRTTRKLSLTETGTAYLERVRQILRDIDDADTIATSQSQNPTGTLRIYAHLSFGQKQLAKLVPLYSRKFPDVSLDITLSDRTVDLVEEGFDLGMFIGLQKFDASMIVRQIGMTEVVMCASPEYVKRHGGPAKPEDITRHTCLNFSYEQLRNGWPIQGSNGAMTNIPITSKVLSNNGELLRQCAISGMGIVLRPSFTLSDDLVSGKLVRLLPTHHLNRMSVMMVYPSRRLLSATVRSFVDFIHIQFPEPDGDPWIA